MLYQNAVIHRITIICRRFNIKGGQWKCNTLCIKKPNINKRVLNNPLMFHIEAHRNLTSVTGICCRTCSPIGQSLQHFTYGQITADYGVQYRWRAYRITYFPGVVKYLVFFSTCLLLLYKRKKYRKAWLFCWVFYFFFGCSFYLKQLQ